MEKFKWQRGSDGYILVRDGEIVAYARREQYANQEDATPYVFGGRNKQVWVLRAFGGRVGDYPSFKSLKEAADNMPFDD